MDSRGDLMRILTGSEEGRGWGERPERA